MTDDEREAKRLRHEAGRRACDLLGFGPGCRDGGCVLFGPGTKVNAMHTNSMCHCIEDGPDGRRRRPHETRAIRAAIKAALAVLLAEVTTDPVPKLPRVAQAMAGEVELLPGQCPKCRRHNGPDTDDCMSFYCSACKYAYGLPETHP